MNFDADRLSRLSGLSPIVNTGVITESKETEAHELEECCGCSGVAADHDPEYGPMTMSSPERGMSHGRHGDDEQHSNLSDLILFEVEEAPEEEEEVVEVDEIDVDDVAEETEEPAPLTMETLRDTVLELRNEILAEQAEERQALAEAPARTAIRKEIKALLAEMPADAATNWIYGKKGRPSSTHNKSRATAFAGIGFENSKK